VGRKMICLGSDLEPALGKIRNFAGAGFSRIVRTC